MSDAIANHRKALRGLSAIAAQCEGSWSSPSPCPGWDARAVVEHVIGFHDELLLQPTGTEPERSQDDAKARWDSTTAAIGAAVTAPVAVDLDQLLPV
jgi:Mycothiol maleylpyruvate isomerase N-terminal domain